MSFFLATEIKEVLAMMKIRITATPPGFAPEKIRKQWVGVKIPYNPEEYSSLQGGVWSGNEQTNGYIVSTRDAIDALLAAGKTKAADYWEKVLSLSGEELRFGKEYCEVCES